MKRGKKIFNVLLFGFILSEIIFCLLIIEYGNGDIQGMMVKTVFSLMLYYFYFKGYQWAKWLFSIGVMFLGLLMIPAGIEQGVWIFYLLSLFYLSFGITILASRSVKTYIKEVNGIMDIEENGLTDKKKSIIKADNYPMLLDRIKTNTIDVFVIIVFMAITSFLLTKLSVNNSVIKGILFFLIFSYEPIMTAVNKTLGQRLIGIKVRKNTIKGENISLASSYVRYIVKMLLGVFSLFTISFNDQKRAIHDTVINSVVTK